MEITDVKFRKVQNREDSRMKAVVSIVLDNLLAVHDIRIIKAPSRFIVVMPSRKGTDGIYKDIVHPVERSFREYIESVILGKYFELFGQQDAENNENI